MAVAGMAETRARGGVRERRVLGRGRSAVTGLVVLVVSLVVAAVLPHGAVAVPRSGSLTETHSVSRAQPLSAVLAANGTLRLRNGSFDARGYRLTFARDGGPRFVRAAVTSDAVWSDRFGDVGQPAEATGLSAVAVSGADVYVGGTFTALNLDTPVVSANHVARWNGRGGRRWARHRLMASTVSCARSRSWGAACMSAANSRVPVESRRAVWPGGTAAAGRRSVLGSRTRPAVAPAV